MYFDWTKNDYWFEIKILINCKKLCDNKQFIKGEIYQNAMQFLFKKLNIFSPHVLQFGRVIGPIETELNQMEPQYINNLGNWKTETQDD